MPTLGSLVANRYWPLYLCNPTASLPRPESNNGRKPLSKVCDDLSRHECPESTVADCCKLQNKKQGTNNTDDDTVLDLNKDVVPVSDKDECLYINGYLRKTAPKDKNKTVPSRHRKCHEGLQKDVVQHGKVLLGYKSTIQ